jgi:branched-chain amino acid transport system permease protein
MFLFVRLGSILAALGGCMLLDVIVRQTLDQSLQRLVLLAGLYVTLAVSLNLINGITGQFSIGHAAFYQIGAYLTGFLSVTYYQAAPIQGIPWLLLMVVAGAIFAGIAGFLVGLPSLRLRGDYLAIVTLGFGEIIRIIVINTNEFGAAYGLNVTPKFILPGHFTIAWVWLLAVLCIAVCRNLLKTAHGLPFLAVREDEVASAAMGVHVTRIKVTAFIIGSMFAGAAGALLAHYEGFINPGTFGMDVSFIILTMVVLGGTGSITGSALAAAFLFYLPEYLRELRAADGTPLTISGAGVIAALAAIAIAVSVIKRIMDYPTTTKLQKTGLYLGAFVGGLALAFILTVPLRQFPALAQMQVEAGQLRMVIFAITLIILMLLRPQGVLAHHEFSWEWVKRLFGRGRSSNKAVSA